MMIAILITSLIVSLSYGSYRRFTDVLKDDSERLKGLNEMMMLERDLFRLVDSSLSIEIEEDILYFNQMDSYSMMEFGDSLMALITDEEVKITHKLADWSVTYLSDQSQYVKGIRLRIIYKHFPYDIQLMKVYSRSFLYSTLKE